MVYNAFEWISAAVVIVAIVHLVAGKWYRNMLQNNVKKFLWTWIHNEYFIVGTSFIFSMRKFLPADKISQHVKNDRTTASVF